MLQDISIKTDHHNLILHLNYIYIFKFLKKPRSHNACQLFSDTVWYVVFGRSLNSRILLHLRILLGTCLMMERKRKKTHLKALSAFPIRFSHTFRYIVEKEKQGVSNGKRKKNRQDSQLLRPQNPIQIKSTPFDGLKIPTFYDKKTACLFLKCCCCLLLLHGETFASSSSP